MASDKDKEVESLLGEIETRKFLYEEDLATQVDPEQLTEDAKMLKRLESQLRALLGNNTPDASAEDDAQPGPAGQESSIVEPIQPLNAASENNTPSTGSSSSGSGPSPHQPGSARPNFRTDLLDITPQTYTPSNAPSPFVTQANRSQGVPTPLALDPSRKRPRHDSATSPVLSAPPKRQALVNEYEARMEELSAELDASIDDLKKFLDKKRKNEASRKEVLPTATPRLEKLKIGDIEYKVNDEFRQAAIMAADELDLDELDAAKLCTEVPGVDASEGASAMAFKAVIQFQNFRCVLLDCLRLLLQSSYKLFCAVEDIVIKVIKVVRQSNLWGHYLFWLWGFGCILGGLGRIRGRI